MQDSQSFYVQEMEPAMAQRMGALKEANRVRLYRGRLRRQIAAGECPWHVVLSDPDCSTMLLTDALKAVPSGDRGRVGRLLLRSHISAWRTVGSLTDRQRRELKDNVT